MEKVKILVVDDEIIVAKDIEKRLGKLGYFVVAIVSSGEEAIAKAEESRPDLVFMDIKLEGTMSGIEAANRIGSLYDIPVVYITAFADENTLKRAKITAPLGYILKPYETKELHIAVELALYKHKTEKKIKESEERYRAYVAATSQLIWIINTDEEITYDVPTWRAFFTCQKESKKNETAWLQAIHQDDRERVAKIFSEATAAKRPFEAEFSLLQNNKNRQRIFVRGVPVLEKNGRVREWVGTSTKCTGNN